MSIIAYNPDPITHDRMEEKLADKFDRYFLRTGPLCTTKNSLPDHLPPTPSECEGAQFEHEIQAFEQK